MKILRHALPLLCASLLGCSSVQPQPVMIDSTAAQPTAEALREIEAAIDQLCQCTGLRRSGRMTNAVLWRKNNRDYAYNADLPLKVDGSSRAFIVRLDSHFRVSTFEPKSHDLSDLSKGLGHDTVKDRVVRDRCIGSVNRLNEHLRWTWYGRPSIQSIGRDFVVTYETIPSAGQGQAEYLDPYVSFVITPKGTVFKVFFGA